MCRFYSTRQLQCENKKFAERREREYGENGKNVTNFHTTSTFSKKWFSKLDQTAGIRDVVESAT